MATMYVGLRDQHQRFESSKGFPGSHGPGVFVAIVRFQASCADERLLGQQYGCSLRGLQISWFVKTQNVAAHPQIQ